MVPGDVYAPRLGADGRMWRRQDGCALFLAYPGAFVALDSPQAEAQSDWGLFVLVMHVVLFVPRNSQSLRQRSESNAVLGPR